MDDDNDYNGEDNDLAYQAAELAARKLRSLEQNGMNRLLAQEAEKGIGQSLVHLNPVYHAVADVPALQGITEFAEAYQLLQVAHALVNRGLDRLAARVDSHAK